MGIHGHTADAVRRIRMTRDPSGEIRLDAQMLHHMSELLHEAEQDSHCRALVIEGEDGAFCRGMNLEAITAAKHERMAVGVQRYVECLRSLRESTKVVIALVDGEALGGGVGLAAAADLIIATEDATFGLPEVVIGLVPGAAMTMLFDRMPAQKVRRFALSGQSISAREALECGLVDRVVPAAADLSAALRDALRQVLRAEPLAVALVKRLCDCATSSPRDDALTAGAECTGELLAQPSRIAAIADFIDGGLPPWFRRPAAGDDK